MCIRDRIAYTTTNPSVTKAKERVMVNNITPTVASENLKLEETVTIVGPNTHLKGVLHMAKNVIILKRRDITPNVVAPELNPSLHIISPERSITITLTLVSLGLVVVYTVNLCILLHCV